MKLIGLSVPTDGKAIYREIAEITKTGAAQEPAQTMKVQLYELAEASGELVQITKEEITKLANKLRNGLREFGRFNVKIEGNIAEIAVRAPKKKVATLTDAPKVPAAKKAAKA